MPHARRGARPDALIRKTTAFLLLLGSVCGLAQERERDGDDPRARMEYIERSTTSGDRVPAGARLKALDERERMIEREGRQWWQRATQAPSTAGATPLASASQWTAIGPSVTNTPFSYTASSGRISALAVDPSDATGQTVYAGAAQGGVWKTTNGGASWVALTDSQPSLAIGSLAIDPGNSQVIYAGTGEQNGNGGDRFYGAGILKSTDGGTTWTNLARNYFAPGASCVGDGVCGGDMIGAIAVRPGASNELLAAVESTSTIRAGINRSTDGGVTWTPIFNLRTATSVIFANSTIAYAGIDSQGVYKSVDGGATWSPANGISPSPTISIANTGRVTVAVADSTGSTVYAIVANDSGALGGLYKTINGGGSWTKLSIADFCGGGGGTPQCWYDQAVAVNPTNANVVFAGGSGTPNSSYVLRSTNAGSAWTVTTGAGTFHGIHADVHAMAFSANGSRLYAGTDGGVFMTTQMTTSPVAWSDLNTNLEITQFYSNFDIDPNNANSTFAGAQDNGTQHYTGGLPWDIVACGDGASAVINATNPMIVYTNCQGVDVEAASDGGAGFGSFFQRQSGINSGDKSEFIPPMVGDKSNGDIVYFGTYRLYQTRNAAMSWSAISGPVNPTNDLLSPTDTITAIAIAPSDSNVLYMGSASGKVQRADNAMTLVPPALADFTDVTGTSLPVAFISSIAVDPTDPNAAYLAMTGFNHGHVFATTTGGVNWIDISADLPDIPARAIVADSDMPGTLYVGTDVGVFRSQDNGGSWQTLATGMPNVAVYGLRLHRGARILRAATHGRGFWDLAVPVIAGPTLEASPSLLSFTNQLIGTASMAQSVTLTASGGNISFAGVAATGDFSVTNGCPLTLANGGTCPVSVAFTPTASGLRNGVLTVTSNAAGSPLNISLAGTGMAPVDLSPAVVTFSSSLVGTTTSGKVITYFNNTAGPVAIASIAANGDYQQSNNCGSTLAAGASCSIVVAFRPTASGARNSTLTVIDNAAGSPRVVGLNGTGVDFALAATRPARPNRTAAGAPAVLPGEALHAGFTVSTSSPSNGVLRLRCEGVPRGAMCLLPESIDLQSGAWFTVHLQTSKSLARRLGAATGTPPGEYGVRVVASSGAVERAVEFRFRVIGGRSARTVRLVSH
jgi:photosystem II stability/assembly factor-like uncharacterized protein